MGVDGKVKAPAAFLDRDGVINRAMVRGGRPYPPQSVAELTILPDVAEAVALLRRLGYRLVVVTNQPDVARGTQSRAAVEAINAAIAAQTGITDFRVCYHDDADACDCRKPKPGLLLSAARDLDLDLGRSVMVGDRWRDIEAGRNAGVMTVWLDHGYDEPAPTDYDQRAGTLLDAARWLAGRVDPKPREVR